MSLFSNPLMYGTRLWDTYYYIIFMGIRCAYMYTVSYISWALPAIYVVLKMVGYLVPCSIQLRVWLLFLDFLVGLDWSRGLQLYVACMFTLCGGGINLLCVCAHVVVGLGPTRSARSLLLFWLQPLLFNTLQVRSALGAAQRKKLSFRNVSNVVVQLLHTIKFSMEVPFSNMAAGGGPGELKVNAARKVSKQISEFIGSKYMCVKLSIALFS